MRTCAFLTLDDPSGYVMDDHLAVAPLRDLGWRVDLVPWRRPGVAWHAYDAVVIRSTWDYAKDPDSFLRTLEDVERAGTPLLNGLDIVRWNLRKTYLRDLAARGVPIVPTVWRDRVRPGELPGLLEELGATEAVVKPVVGASAGGTFRLDGRSVRAEARAVEAYYRGLALMVQPFVPAVVTEGEFSLLYFNGQYSHAVLKAPKSGDFRVQEEHGGLVRAARPDEALLAAGHAALGAIGDVPLYARADLVRANDGRGFWLMELELIEPSLYLRTDERAPERFARALHERVTERAAHSRPTDGGDTR